MNLTKILQPTCIKVPLESKDKKSAIIELVDLLDKNDLLLLAEGHYDEVNRFGSKVNSKRSWAEVEHNLKQDSMM